MKMLRQRLVQAGIFDPRAVGFFFSPAPCSRSCSGRSPSSSCRCCIGADSSMIWAAVGVGGLFGYLAPSLVLDRIIAARRLEYRAGFPDFMDLLVVCADAGLGMASALERVGRELGTVLSQSERQHPHGQSRNARRPHHQRGARSFRRPARPRRGALVRHADPAVGRTRLQHHRRACASTARTCGTSGCRRPRRRPTRCPRSSRSR